MTYTSKIVVSTREIENEVKLQYGIDIYPLANLFWEGEYQNDCYKQLFFSDAHIREDGERASRFGDDEAAKRVLVMCFLKDIFPDHTSVLVDVSW